jgi:hypothetical protein
VNHLRERKRVYPYSVLPFRRDRNSTRPGARFAGGGIEGMRKKSITVNTPNAALAVRGTHFWAGPIEGKYGVLLLKGKVRVSGR